MSFLQNSLPYILAGVSVGGQYALIAIGYTMVYGILRLINFAHGDVFMAAGMFMVFLSASMPLGAAIPLVLILTVLLVVGIVYAVLQMVIILLLAIQLDGAYSGALQLLRRVPPLACSQHQSLLNYLLNKKAEKSEDKMTSSKSVIFMSSDSVF